MRRKDADPNQTGGERAHKDRARSYVLCGLDRGMKAERNLDVIEQADGTARLLTLKRDGQKIASMLGQLHKPAPNLRTGRTVVRGYLVASGGTAAHSVRNTGSP